MSISIPSRKSLQPLFLLLASLLFLAFLAGCAKDDLYSPCDLSSNARNQNQSACAGEEVKACAVPRFLNCETRVCAKYSVKQEGKPFCSLECKADKECGKGKCIAIMPGLAAKYCVPDDQL